MPRGTSWQTGARRAFLKAAFAAPREVEAWRSLAFATLLSVPGDVPVVPRMLPDWSSQIVDYPQTGGRVNLEPETTAIYGAVRAGVVDPLVFRACLVGMIFEGNLGGARDCGTRALLAGQDSTWQLLRLAWLSYHESDSVGGDAELAAAVAAAHDSASRTQIGWLWEREHDPHAAYSPFDIALSVRPNLGAAGTELLQKREWLALPDSELTRWVIGQLGTSEGKATWSDPRAVGLHFFMSLTLGDGGDFRPCIPDRDTVAVCVRRGKALPRDLVAARWRGWDPTTEAPISLVRFVRPSQGRGESDSIEVRQWNGPGDSLLDTIVVSSFAAGHDAASGNDLIVRRLPNERHWSVVLAPTASTDAPMTFQESQDALGTSGAIALSDVAIGPASAVAPSSAVCGETFVVRPRIDRNAGATVCYQVRSRQVPIAIAITETVMATTGGSHPSVAIRTSRTLGATTTTVATAVDLRHLRPGSYRLVIEIGEDPKSPGARAITKFELY